MRKIGLSVREAGWLLSKSEPQVRRLLAKGQLEYAVQLTLVDPDSIRRLFARDSSLNLRALALGRLLPALLNDLSR
ncbi:MAG TPA: hypothetical protein VIM33_10555 [Gaiellaceae bacterium]